MPHYLEVGNCQNCPKKNVWVVSVTQQCDMCFLRAEATRDVITPYLISEVPAKGQMEATATKLYAE